MRAFHSLVARSGGSRPSTPGCSASPSTWRPTGIAPAARGARVRRRAGDRGGMDAHRARSRPAARTRRRVRAEQRERIRRALDALPPKARTIIMLSDVEGLSYREIAEVLDCPIGTVMSRLHNARKRLAGGAGAHARVRALARHHAGAGAGHAGRGPADDPLRRARAPGVEPRRPDSPSQQPPRQRPPVPAPGTSTPLTAPSPPPPPLGGPAAAARSSRGCAPCSATPTTPPLERQRAEGRSARSSASRCRATAGSRSRRTSCRATRCGCACGSSGRAAASDAPSSSAAPGAPAVLGGPGARRRGAHHHPVGQPQPGAASVTGAA